jgi:hypothetical protein
LRCAAARLPSCCAAHAAQLGNGSPAVTERVLVVTLSPPAGGTAKTYRPQSGPGTQFKDPPPRKPTHSMRLGH